MWKFFQNEGIKAARFDISRQQFMVRQCRAGQSVLNIGVGDGTSEQLALARGIDVYSLDPDAKAIARLREALSLGEKAQVGYAQNMPFESEQFDVVIMAEVIEHLEDETLHKSLEEVLRVLKPKWGLILSTPYRENLEAAKVFCPYCEKKFHPYGHVQSFDKARLLDLLQSLGYHPVRVKLTTFVRWYPLSPTRIIRSAVRLLLARFGDPIADPRLVAWAYKPVGGA
ncbi:MAG: class I SAM-dependent methyltransferase [Armatimonadota bacterium]